MIIYDSAITFAARGWQNLPLHSIDQTDGCCTCGNANCGSPGKHPLTPSGVKDATTDTETIKRWCNETNGMANIGIATGNGLVVVDVDAKSGGMDTLGQLQKENGDLPLTPTVNTGGGGRHYYFALPNGVSVSNKVAVAKGIDVRSDGGYVVAPPSIHKSGQNYSWMTPEDTPLAEVPAWLVKIIQGDAAVSPSKSLKIEGFDLTTDAGACEGERNATLCRLAGIHLARGESVEVIEPLALAWADRCTPDYPNDEVLATLFALARKHEQQQNNGRVPTIFGPAAADDVEAIPLASPPPWPVLGAEAYHGFVGDIVGLIEPQTEADPVAIVFSFLVCVGNFMGRKVWFPVEGDKHHVNLFATLVGQSSRGRKGTSLGRTLGLWDELDPWRTDRISSGLSSGEGVKYHVRNPVEVLEPVKEKGKIVSYQAVVKDPGVSDKRLLVVESELAQALRVIERQGNTLSPVLRQAWDTGNLKTLTKNDPVVATEAHISILGHITSDELAKLLSDSDTANGFANRFLWVLVKRSKLLPDGGAELDLTPLRSRLQKVLASVDGRMSRSPEAQRLWHQLYPLLTAERPGRFGMVTSRAEAQTLRLSMAYAILDGSTIIHSQHLKAAYAVWQYAEASARFIFGEGNQLPPLEKKLLQLITDSPGMNRKNMYKALGGHVNAEAMVKALGQLAKLGLARREMVSTGGRPCESWSPARPKVDTDAVALAAAAAQSNSLGLPNVVPFATAGANERTKGNGDEKTEGLRSDSSLVRSPQAEAMPLADFLMTVQQLGGKIVRSATDTFVIEGVDDNLLTPDIVAALTIYQSDLAMLVPTVKPMTEKKDEFLQELLDMNKPPLKAAALTIQMDDKGMSEDVFFQKIRDIEQPASTPNETSPDDPLANWRRLNPGSTDEFLERMRNMKF